MTELVLHRAHGPYQDRARLYRVRLDDADVASIAAGEEKRFVVQPGKHTLQLKIDWCRSNLLDLTIQSGEAQRYTCGPNATPFLGLIYATFLRNQYLYVRRESGKADQPAHSPISPLANSAVGNLPPISAARYAKVLLALFLGVAIIGVTAWLVMLAQRSFNAPRFVFILVAGAAIGGAAGATLGLCKRALLRLDRQ